MPKLKFLILFIFFIQVVPNFLDMLEKELDGLSYNQCIKSNGKSLYIETSAQCVKRNAFLSKEDDGSKCCFYSGKIDPLFFYKKNMEKIGKKLLLKVEAMI